MYKYILIPFIIRFIEVMWQQVINLLSDCKPSHTLIMLQKLLENKEMAIYEKFLAIFDKGIS